MIDEWGSWAKLCGLELYSVRALCPWALLRWDCRGIQFDAVLAVEILHGRIVNKSNARIDPTWVINKSNPRVNKSKLRANSNARDASSGAMGSTALDRIYDSRRSIEFSRTIATRNSSRSR